MTPVAIFVGVVLAVLVLCAAIWRALIADGALPHYDDNPGDVQ